MTITKLLSLAFGVIADTRFPRAIQCFINKQYVRIFHIDLGEFQPYYAYKSLNALFTRALRQNRAFDKNSDIIISPCDGKITQAGHTKEGRALQIKGFSYDVARLLGEEVRENLAYANIYLSPSNYHRYHAPCDLFVEQITHFKGALLPVHNKSLNKHPNLFITNERVVLKARNPSGKLIYFVAVGALNVGKIIFHCEPRLQESYKGKSRIFAYKEPKFIKKGEELGMFKMGSTIVIFAQNVEYICDKIPISFGENLFQIRSENARNSGEDSRA